TRGIRPLARAAPVQCHPTPPLSERRENVISEPADARLIAGKLRGSREAMRRAGFAWAEMLQVVQGRLQTRKGCLRGRERVAPYRSQHIRVRFGAKIGDKLTTLYRAIQLHRDLWQEVVPHQVYHGNLAQGAAIGGKRHFQVSHFRLMGPKALLNSR